MLRVGLTGGIGSGKSTVAARLVERGAVLVDSDRIAREVVEPGTDGLAEIVAAFGERVVGPGGALDRPALAALVFGDAEARARLNAIVHPRVRRRSDELIAAAPADAIVVQDVPLLVEGGMASMFPLVVVVHAEAEARVRRLVEHRGMPEVDARARIAAQADDAARRAAADVWLDNSGPRDALEPAIDALWDLRLLPFAANLRARRPAPCPAAVVPADSGRPTQAARLAARIAAAAGGLGRGVEHVGPTAVPGRAAPDVLDLQLGVADPTAPARLDDALAEAGFPALHGPAERASADPGRPARLTVRRVGSPQWRQALLLRDRARAGADGADEASGDIEAAERWAESSGWTPSLP